MHGEPRELLADAASTSTTNRHGEEMLQRGSQPRRRAAGRGAAVSRPRVRNPAALLHGPAHVVVHGNRPFVAEFGDAAVGLPAAEALLDLPRAAFQLMDRVFDEGRPLALWIAVRGARRRLTVIERRDVGTGEVYGIAMHLVPEPGSGPGATAEEGNR